MEFAAREPGWVCVESVFKYIPGNNTELLSVVRFVFVGSGILSLSNTAGLPSMCQKSFGCSNDIKVNTHVFIGRERKSSFGFVSSSRTKNIASSSNDNFGQQNPNVAIFHKVIFPHSSSTVYAGEILEFAGPKASPSPFAGCRWVMRAAEFHRDGRQFLSTLG